MGELGELAFEHRAASLGFGVAKPHGDNERYDFIVDSGERLWRVQVKSTFTGHGRGYRAPGGRGNQKRYKAREIDFVVVYIAPLDLWYVVPIGNVAASRFMAFYPSGSKLGGSFEYYREAWHLMAPGADLKLRPLVLPWLRTALPRREWSQERQADARRGK